MQGVGSTYKRDVLVVIKMGAYIHGGAYSLWMPIILILILVEELKLQYF